MTIRMRLFLWLLPLLIIFVACLSIFFYLYLYRDVFALAGTEIPATLIDNKLQNTLTVLLTSAGIAIALVSAVVFFIANRISEPVQKLKTAALSIAAGEYGQTIEVKGPTEIVELANMLNTVSECVQEHITRLQENALVRERLFGEYECSLLMQYHMLQKVVDEYHSSQVSMQLIKIKSSEASRGVYLKLQTEENGDVRFTLVEAKEPGFEGIYELLPQVALLTEKTTPLSQLFPIVDAMLHLEDSSLTYTAHVMAPPLVWSIERNQFADAYEGSVPVHSGDFIFFFNRGFSNQFPDHQTVQDWLSKVLRHFSSDGLDVLSGMLSSELSFLTNKQSIEEDLCILCIRRV